jgi:hypothetical protein
MESGIRKSNRVSNPTEGFISAVASGYLSPTKKRPRTDKTNLPSVGEVFIENEHDLSVGKAKDIDLHGSFSFERPVIPNSNLQCDSAYYKTIQEATQKPGTSAGPSVFDFSEGKSNDESTNDICISKSYHRPSIYSSSQEIISQPRVSIDLNESFINNSDNDSSPLDTNDHDVLVVMSIHNSEDSNDQLRQLKINGTNIIFHKEIPGTVKDVLDSIARDQNIFIPTKRIVKLIHIKKFNLNIPHWSYCCYVGHDYNSNGKKVAKTKRKKWEDIPSNINVNDTFYYLCLLCAENKEKKYLLKASTSSVKQISLHMSSFHSLSDIGEKKRRKVVEDGKFDYSERFQQIIFKRVIDLIVDQCLSFNIIEAPSFRLLINDLNPKISLPSRFTLPRVIQSIVENNVIMNYEHHFVYFL